MPIYPVVCACVLSGFSHDQLLVTPWTVALQTPLSMGFSNQEYWSGLPCPSLGDLPDSGIKPASLAATAAKSLQSCPTLCDPTDTGPLSLGFSRQEHWSELPFPSPMHESEKRK